MVTSKSREGLPMTVPEAKILHKKKTEPSPPITIRKLRRSLENNYHGELDVFAPRVNTAGFRALLSIFGLFIRRLLVFFLLTCR